VVGKIASYALIAGIVLAVWFARRKGRLAFQAAIAGAHAAGMAEVHAQLTAAATSSVDVGGVHLYVGDNRAVDLGSSPAAARVRGGYLPDDTPRFDPYTGRALVLNAARHSDDSLPGDFGALVAGRAVDCDPVLRRTQREGV
jgi:hypothetical protein